MNSLSDITIHPGRERAALSDAWRSYYENPAAALVVTDICRQRGAAGADANLAARALALAAAIALHRGDTGKAAALVDEARRSAGDSPDPRTGADVAAVTAQLGFHTGDYGLARAEVERALELADASGDLTMRIRARRATCMVYGSLQLPNARHLVDELLGLAKMTDEPWEEAISRNDLACVLSEEGELAGAEAETERALKLLGPVGNGNRFSVGVVLATRADVRLAAGRPKEALADAEMSVRLLTAVPEPDPYVLAAAVRAQLEALVGLGRSDDARDAGAAALDQIGNRVPHARSRLMIQLAEALTQAGFGEEGSAMLAAAHDLQRDEKRH